MSRPKKKEGSKTKHIHIRLTEEEYALLYAMADTFDVTVTVIIGEGFKRLMESCPKEIKDEIYAEACRRLSGGA